MSPSTCLNLGIVAHVDAGKTSLTERLLYESGAIDAPGSVDAGTTRTDSLDLERRRGITIRASVTSFDLPTSAGALTVNLLDTPGHPDFIAEVERSLAVLDAAVLVLSAVEGVQPQTVAIWRALRRIDVPTVLFVNKIDRGGADVARVVEQVRRRLTDRVVVLADAEDQGGRGARAVPRHDVRRAARRAVRRGSLTPVLCGSAITGAGTDLLRSALTDLVPPRDEGDPGVEASGSVFAVDRDERGRRVWVRMWAGELRLRDRVSPDGGRATPVTELAVSRPGGLEDTTCVTAGEIAVVRGPVARIGDGLGSPPPRRTPRFAPPSLQALVEPEDPTRRTAMFAGLSELADEDPLIGLHLDPHDGEAAVSLHGEVQKEVVGALLEERYGVRVRFSDTSVLCVERTAGSGSAVDRIGQRGNPYLATVGLRVAAAPVGHGVEFDPGVERGNLPAAFITATEEGVRAAVRQGLHGWEVTDCVVTMTESGYYPRQSRPHQKFDKSMSSVAGDFRHLTPVVLLAALARAGTRVCEPVDAFDLELPESHLGSVAPLLGRLRGEVRDSSTAGGYLRLTGTLPAAAVPDLAARLPDLTSGEGVLATTPDHHAPVVRGPVPTRPHRGHDPRDRRAWFRDVAR